MKNIKIITFQNAHNYGAQLQVFALQKELSKENNVEVINYKNETIGNSYKVINIKKSSVISFIKSVIKSVIFYNKNIKRFKKFNEFIKNKIKLTSEIYENENDLKEKSPKSDIYITGSDQVWNSKITEGLKDSYTLNFGDNSIKRISYAASIGNSCIDNSEKEEYKNKISIIDNISVREESGKEALKELIDKPIEVVLDPTLLISKEEWECEINNIKDEKEKYILAYMVEPDEEYVKIVNEISNNENLKVIHFSHRKGGLKNIFRTAFTDGPLEFVKLIKNAEYVICTSFHATVFSIIFNKKFFVIPHRKTGARVTNLLDRLNIEGRVYYTLEDFKKINYSFESDWNLINKKIEEERQKSLNWLNNAISN